MQGLAQVVVQVAPLVACRDGVFPTLIFPCG